MIKPWIRSLIFWSFIAFFFISAPLTVLYTAGYRYNFQNGRILHTGVISVNTTPKNASISLNGKITDKTTPYIFKRLMPDLYTVSIMRDGFHAWTGNVEVKSGITTFIQPILLFKNSIPELLLKEDATSIAMNNETKAAYIINEGGWTEIWLYNVEDKTQIVIEHVTEKILSKDAQLTWSAEGTSLLVFDPSTDFVRAYSANGIPLKIDNKIANGTQRAFWHPTNDSLLYLSLEDTLYQVETPSGAVTIFESNNAESVILDSSILSFFDNGTNIELRQTTNNTQHLVALLPRDTYEIVERYESFLILRNKKGNITLLNINNSQPILLETHANLYDWLGTDNILVYSDGIEVNMYDPSTHQTTFITRQGETIENVFWHPSGLSILLITHNSVSTIERYRIAKTRQSTSLLQDVDVESFSIGKTGRFSYFYGTVNGDRGIFSLQLTR